MHLFTIILSADPEQRLPSRIKKEWRDISMDMFFKRISDDGLESINFERGKEEDVYFELCDWYGVKCTDETVTEVTYRNFNHGNFNIGFLPHSVESICIIESHQRFPIDTRSFPKRLKKIWLNDNEIFGRIDLECLPTDLREAYFTGNNISGPISLTNLPQKMDFLWLNKNPINQDVVPFGNMPQYVEIRLPKRRGKRGIKCAHSVSDVQSFRGKISFE